MKKFLLIGSILLVTVVLIAVFGLKNLFEEKIEQIPNHKLLNQKISFNKVAMVAYRDGTIGGPKDCTKLCQLSGGVNRSITDLQGLGTISGIQLEYIFQNRSFLVVDAYLDSAINFTAGPIEILILQDIDNSEKYKITASQFEFYPKMRIIEDRIASKHLFEVAEKNGGIIKIKVYLKPKDGNISESESENLQQISEIQDEFINKLPTYFNGKNLTKDKSQLGISMDVNTNDLAYLISSRVPLNIDSILELIVNKN